MAEMITLEATKREIVGKQVRHLRREGIIPGVLYGPGFEPLQLQLEWTTLRPTLLEAGGSQIIELNVDGDKYNALVRQVHRAPLRAEVLHIDFYHVRMDVAIRTEVPIVTMGDSDHIEDQGGVATHETTSIEVECLPTDLPAEIEVDLSLLKEVGDSITVADLPQLQGVTYLVDDDVVIVSTSYMRVEEEEEEEEEEITGEMEEPELIRRREEEEEDEG